MNTCNNLEGEQCIRAAEMRTDLGWHCKIQGDLGSARRHLQRASEVFAERGEFDSVDAIRSQFYLGVVAFNESRLTEARFLLQHAVEAISASLGESHGQTIAARFYLGATLELQRDYAGARNCYESLVRDNLDALMKWPEMTVLAYARMMSIAVREGERERAAEIGAMILQYCRYSRAEWKLNRDLHDSLDRENYRSYSLGISLALDNTNLRPIAATAAEYALNCKGSDWFDNNESAAVDDPSRESDAFRQWRSLHRLYRETSLRFNRTTRTGAAHRDDANLPKRIESARLQLSDHHAIFQHASPWATLSEVRQSMPPGAVLIEFVRFHRLPVESSSDPVAAEYAAWIIPAAECGELSIVELGPAEPIDAAIFEIQQAMAIAIRPDSPLAAFGEAKTVDDINAKFTAVRRLALDPLLPQLDSFDRWIVSPDGMLWFMPWGAATMEDGRFLVEHRSLQCVASGRDLLRQRSAPSMRRGLVITNPDYNSDRAENNTPDAPTLSKPLATDSNRNTTRLTMRIDDQRNRRSDLIALDRYLGEPPMIFRGKQASESALLKSSQPRIFVAETDAYLPAHRDDILLRAQRHSGSEQDNENGTGLFMAGANNRLQNARPVGEDGILTGPEILRANLRGTEIVVLNGAISGTPDSKACEGFSELLRKFQFAGAESVAATLWKPPANDQTLLMKDFWDGLKQGMSRSQALRAAQLARIKEHRERNSAAHPYYWAAPILVGID